MFDRKYTYQYLAAVCIIGIASYFGDKIKQGLTSNDAENEMIRQYLLNDSPLYGMNRPKLWIHTTYEKNARQWKDFYSRNSTDLNQPYIHLTIKSIINHCGGEFNICLIDDESFTRLLPDWKVDLVSIPTPLRSVYREFGMMRLLHLYGGITVPNSFICMKSLMPLYSECSEGNPCVSEEINRTTSTSSSFAPSMKIMCARKGCPVIREFMEYLDARTANTFLTSESEFLGITQKWLNNKIEAGTITIISGKKTGVKTTRGKPILLEDLMSEDFLNLDKDALGIYIPADEVLKRTKYQWLAQLSSEEVMKTNIVIIKYLKASIVDTTNEYFTDKEIKSVASI
jgi:hypothetical protein